MKVSISIDIGTSYSSIYLMGEDGKAQPVDIATGLSMYGSKYSLPSAVFLDEGSFLIGQAAMNSRIRNPKNFVSEFKRELGKNVPIYLGGRGYAPEDFYTLIFEHMKRRVEERTGGAEIGRAYVTYPASYGSKKKQKVVDAAKAAGLFDVELVDEPTAAAMYYDAQGLLGENENLLVYDFGGGTFDASLIRHEDGQFHRLTVPMGLDGCGGADIDRLIYADMMRTVSDTDAKLLEQIHRNPNFEMRFQCELAELAVKAKEQLSSAETFSGDIQAGFDFIPYRLTRDRFNQMIASLVGQTISLCYGLLQQAGLKTEDLSAVLLVGGTSRVPLVHDMVRQFAGSAKVLEAGNPDLAVAAGALEWRNRGKAGNTGGHTGMGTGSGTDAVSGGGTAAVFGMDTVSGGGAVASSGGGTAEGSGADALSGGGAAAGSGMDAASEGGTPVNSGGNGNPEAGPGTQQEPDLRGAARWKERAGSGDAQAQYQYYRILAAAENPQRDEKEAKTWLWKAAVNGCAQAQWELACCYDAGTLGIKPDSGDALRWYREAALHGHTLAAYETGRREEEGIGTGEDRWEAIRYYEKAAAAGHPEAQNRLAALTGTVSGGLAGSASGGGSAGGSIGSSVSGDGLAGGGAAGHGATGSGSVSGGSSDGISGSGTAGMDFGGGEREEQPLERLKRLAGQGDTKAQKQLADAYYYGKGVQADKKEAFRWYKLSADLGNAASCYDTGFAYYKGEGVEQSDEEAVRYLRMGAEKGNAPSQYHLGICYKVGRGVGADLQEACRLFRASAEAGNREAAKQLGDCFYYGWGTAIDKEEAVRWYKISADKGYAAACYDTAYAYRFADGVRRNSDEAFRYAKKGAEAGNVHAQWLLGDCYYVGSGTKENYEEALKWFRKSADQGQMNACYGLGMMYYKGHGTSRDYVEAVRYLTKAVQKGHHKAEKLLGDCYYDGLGVGEDKSEAFRLFKKSADGGYGPGCYDAAYAYYKAEGTGRDYDAAFRYAKKGAECGNRCAIELLGECYYFGRGTQKDLQKAFQYFEDSYQKGERMNAAYFLGLCYKEGHGTARNQAKARELIREAANNGSPGAKKALEKGLL